MNKRTRRNFLGCRALLVCGAGRDRTMLKQQLRRLGIEPCIAEDASTGVLEGGGDFDVVFFDSDGGRQVADIDALIARVNGPAVALIGSDAPSTVDWVIDRGACAFLMKPLRGTGILASLVIAFHAFEERRVSARTIADLRRRLSARQVVCAAAVQVMRVFDVVEDDAFRIMRVSSMERRIALEDLAAMIVSGELTPSSLARDMHARRQAPKQGVRRAQR